MAGPLRLIALAVVVAVATASRVLLEIPETTIPETIPNKRVFAVRGAAARGDANANGNSANGKVTCFAGSSTNPIVSCISQCRQGLANVDAGEEQPAVAVPRLHGARLASRVDPSDTDSALSCLPHRSITVAQFSSTQSTCTTSSMVSSPAVRAASVIDCSQTCHTCNLMFISTCTLFICTTAYTATDTCSLAVIPTCQRSSHRHIGSVVGIII
jgi:hypothetical protein